METDKQQITDTHGRYKKRTFAKDQTRFSLRIDDELAEWVERQGKDTTKNRYLNGLIRQDMEQSKLQEIAIKQRMTLGEVMTVCRLNLEDFEKRLTDKVKEEVARHQRVRQTPNKTTSTGEQTAAPRFFRLPFTRHQEDGR